MKRLLLSLFIVQILYAPPKLTVNTQNRNELTFDVSVPIPVTPGRLGEVIQYDQEMGQAKVILQLEFPVELVDDLEALALNPITSFNIRTYVHRIEIQTNQLFNAELPYCCSEANVEAIWELVKTLAENQTNNSYRYQLAHIIMAGAPDNYRSRVIAEVIKGQDKIQCDVVLQYLETAFPLKNRTELEAALEFYRSSS